MKKLNVGFIGGLTNGKIILDYLLANKYVNIPLVITHPKGFSAPRSTILNTNSVGNVIRDFNVDDYIEIIKNLKLDLIFVAGWSELISKKVLDVIPMGVIGFHPSKLPKDRGRSVLAWQIEEDYKNTALSMFYYNEVPDGGDIIALENIAIERNDYISDVLEKIDNATYNLINAYFPLIRKRIAPRESQILSNCSYRRLRKDRDSLINWDQNAYVIYNKIRAISNPYPGAFFKHKNQNIIVWRAEILENYENDNKDIQISPGTIMGKIDEKKYVLKCRDKCLLIITENSIQDY